MLPPLSAWLKVQAVELSGTVSGVWVVSCFPGAVRLLKALAGCRSYFETSWGMKDREGYLGSGLLSYRHTNSSETDGGSQRPNRPFRAVGQANFLYRTSVFHLSEGVK